MNTVQNGKGDSPRNNYGPQWYAGYEAIDWHRNEQRQPATALAAPNGFEKRPFRIPRNKRAG